MGYATSGDIVCTNVYYMLCIHRQFFYLYLRTVCVQHMYGHALNSCAGSDGLQFLKEHLVLCKLVLYVMSGCG